MPLTEMEATVRENRPEMLTCVPDGPVAGLIAVTASGWTGSGVIGGVM